LPRPAAILVVSAHWLSRNGVAVSATEQPDTICDFGAVDPDLFRITYPAPGAPRQAGRVAELLTATTVRVCPPPGPGPWRLDGFAASLPGCRHTRVPTEHRLRPAAAVSLRACRKTASVPTNDHYLPLLYTIGLQQPGEALQFLFEGFQYANICTRCLRIG
jgi:aromatic ring-opening dioxygenase catalytic subunit (LigB family)